jgi:protease IV
MVARSRKQDVAAIDAIAQGRVWSGADAKRLGLVDELGDSRTAVELAARLADLGEDYDVEFFDVESGIAEALGIRLQARLAQALAPLVPQSMRPQLPRSLQPVAAELNRIARLSDPRNSYMYCLACTIE